MKWFERGVLIALLLVSLFGLWHTHEIRLAPDTTIILEPVVCPHGIQGMLGHIPQPGHPCHDIPLTLPDPLDGGRG